ncbi:MAG: lectin-like domain-containing protein [Parvicellaceae bacterium]
MGADITSNTLALISQTNGASMNSLGNRIAVGYPVLNQSNYGYNGEVKVFDWDGSSWNQLGNVNSTRGAGGRTGASIALSADGQTLAVISPRLSNGTSLNPFGNTYWSNGVLEIFNWDGSSWNLMGTPFFMQIGSMEDNFTLDINDNGTIVAIGECKLGVNNSTTEGQVSVYEWDGSTWNTKGAVLAGENIGDQFGFSLSLNGTGNRIAVGTPFNDANKGEVKLYEWSNSAWNIIEEFNGVNATKLGHAVSLNSIGDKIAISESDYNSNAGAVSIYVEGTNSWNLVGSQIEGSISGDAFGFKVELNADGNRFLASSIAGNGYTKLYELSGSSWVLKGTEMGDVSGDKFGQAIDINGIGDRFIVGAPYFDNNAVFNTGLVRVFQTAKTCPEPLSVTITELAVTTGTDFSMCEGESYTLSASGGGTYSWSPTTGLDDPTSSTPVATPPAGNYTYTVTASDATGCTGTAQQLLTVLPNDVATFSYSSCCYFTTDTDPTPSFTGTSGGSYSSAAGLTIVASTGEIDLDDSAPGNYEVTYATSSSNACPASSSQNVLIMNENNCNTIDFNVTGNASDLGSYSYEITPNQNSQTGAVWCEAPLNLNYSFHISAELNFGNKDVNGADGIAFVLQESSNTLTHSGGGLGYSVGGASGFSPSLAIEFDTYYNSSDAPAVNSTTDDHLAIQLNGDLNHSSSNALISPVDLGNIEDGNNHPLTIFWDPNPDHDLSTLEGELNVYFDNVLIATLSRDLKSDFTASNNGLVYWGFTASTGGSNNTQVFQYLNSSFWAGRNPTTLSDNINEWQGDVVTATEIVTDPIDNITTYPAVSWFNPCNWSASFVPDYNTDVVIPQGSSYINHPLVNYDQSVFTNHSVINLDMDGDGDIDNDDKVQGKAFAKSLKLEGDALFFIKTDQGAQIKIQE